MNTSTLLPKDVLLALHPGDVSLYLTSHGWAPKPYGAAGRASSSETPQCVGSTCSSTHARPRGLRPRLADLIVALATIEQRPIWEILNDLSAPSGDALRLKIAGSVMSKGSFPLDGAIERFRGKILSVKRAPRPRLPKSPAGSSWPLTSTAPRHASKQTSFG